MNLEVRFHQFCVLFFLSILLPAIGITQNDTLNQTDSEGHKQGYWVYYGKDRPEYDYPSEGRIEEGPYVNNRKEGLWTKYHKDGKTPKLKGHYHNNRPNGAYWKIWPNGNVKEQGSFEKGKYAGNLLRYDSLGNLTYKGGYDAQGVSVSDTFFTYFDNGCLDSIIVWNNIERQSFVINYSVDTCNFLLTETKREHTPLLRGCTFESMISETPVPYVHNDTVIEVDIQPQYAINRKALNRNRLILTEHYPDLNKDIEINHTIDIRSNTLKANGYHKIYNAAGDVFLEGDFNDFKFINGKVYEYDHNGLLVKIKVYKKGVYHSDGQL